MSSVDGGGNPATPGWGPPARSPRRRPWLAWTLVGLALFVVLLGAAAFLLTFGYYAGTMAHIDGPVISTTADQVCVQDTHEGVQCLARAEIRVTNPTASITDGDDLVVGHCLSYRAPKAFDREVPVSVADACLPPATTPVTSTPTTTR